MTPYPHIDSVFKRDMSKPDKPFIEGKWTTPEFEYLAPAKWDWREKVDGTNIRVIVNNGIVEFKGRTDKAVLPVKLLERLQEIFAPQEEALHNTFKDGNACLYGEGYGAGIQKGGGNYGPNQDFVLFDVKVGHWWLKRENVSEIANKFGIDIVPMVASGNLYDAIALCREGFNSNWGDFTAEGIVATPAIDLVARNGSRIITKVKCKEFIKTTGEQK